MNISQPFIHRPIATSLQFHNRANDQIIDAERLTTPSSPIATARPNQGSRRRPGDEPIYGEKRVPSWKNERFRGYEFLRRSYC